MNLDDFFKNKAGFYLIESGFAIWEVKNNDFLHQIDMPEVHIQLFIIRGKINAIIDNQHVILQSDSLTDILHSRMSIEQASEDISVIILFTTEAFLANLINNKPPFPIEYIMQLLQQPVILLTHSQAIIIRGRLELVLDICKTDTHYHQLEMLKCALWMVFLEMSNIFMHQNDDIKTSSGTDSKRMLFMKYIKMLPSHVKQERNISFYASELCISSQYLERVVKLTSGQTAYQWIERTLIGEVNHLLKDTNKSIQQIADIFGFPDQATFTKYYKRNMGMTPTEFRTKNIL